MKRLTAVLVPLVALTLISEVAFSAQKPYLKSGGRSAKCKAIANWYATADVAAGARLVDDVYDQRGYTYAYIDRIFKPAIGVTFSDLSIDKRNKLAKDAKRCDPERTTLLTPLITVPDNRPEWAKSPWEFNLVDHWTKAIEKHDAYDAMSIEERLMSRQLPVRDFQKMSVMNRPSDLILRHDDVRRPFVKDIDYFNAVLVFIDETKKRGYNSAFSSFDFDGQRRPASVKTDRFLEFRPNYLEIAQVESLEIIDHGLTRILDDYYDVKTLLFEKGVQSRQDFLASARQADVFIKLMQATVGRLNGVSWAGSRDLNLQNKEIDARLSAIQARFEEAKNSTTASILQGYEHYMPGLMDELYSLETEEQFAEFMYANIKLFIGDSPGNHALSATTLPQDFWTRKAAIGLSPDKIIHEGWEANRRAYEKAKKEAEARALIGVLTILGGVGGAWLNQDPF